MSKEESWRARVATGKLSGFVHINPLYFDDNFLFVGGRGKNEEKNF